MKLLALFAILALTLVTPAAAAKPVASGTITGPNEAAPYAFGDPITFTVTTANLKGNQYPLVYVACYSVVDGSLLYGQLANPLETFVLGGGSSQWHLQRDDANCTADVRVYGGKNDQGQVVLDALAFGAEG